MLQIAIALSAASPIVWRHRLVLRLRSWMGTAMRLLLSLVVAAAGYFAVIWTMVRTYPAGHPFTLPVYGAGFAVATLIAVIAGALVSPARLSRITVLAVCALAVLFPVGLYVHSVVLERGGRSICCM